MSPRELGPPGLRSGASALARALATTDPAARIAVLNDHVARAIERAGHPVVRGELQHGRLGLEDGAADALAGSGLPDDSDAAVRALRECARVVRPGGRLWLATGAGLARRGPDRSLVLALFLHAGLVDLQQQVSRGVAVTSGRIGRPA